MQRHRTLCPPSRSQPVHLSHCPRLQTEHQPCLVRSCNSVFIWVKSLIQVNRSTIAEVVTRLRHKLQVLAIPDTVMLLSPIKAYVWAIPTIPTTAGNSQCALAVAPDFNSVRLCGKSRLR